MNSSESFEHNQIKHLISAKLQEWVGVSLEEYPSCGHEHDVYAVTVEGVRIYVEIIWSSSPGNFNRDIIMIQEADTDVKLVVVNPEILKKPNLVREFSKVSIAERKSGVAMHGEMINGEKILEDSTYLETDFKEILFNLIESCKQSNEQIIRIKYNENTNYLPRRVCSTRDFNPFINSIFLKDELSQDILDIIDRNNRIVLLSGPGIGKTTELMHIAWHFSNPSLMHYPFFISLDKFVNQKISEMLPPYWTKIPENKVVIILDGLDEIERKNKNDAIRLIESFSEAYPDIKLIVSCRTNFYKIDTENTSGTLFGFSSFVLLNLSRSEVDDYLVANLGIRVQEFKKIIFKNQIHDLLKIPFYLIRLVELFELHGDLPSNKSEIFEQLLRARIFLDVEHFRTTLDLDEHQKTIIDALERLAVGLEIFGRSYVSDDEYKKIIPDSSLRNLIEHCTVWRKTDANPVFWQFEHKNFQEYLAARVLARKPLDVVKALSSFSPYYTKINPSWINTFSFLLTMSDSQPLFDWILSCEPLLMPEPNLIDTKLRIKIFKEIFSTYKTKKIWIPRDKINYDELAKFGQSEETVNFLLNELDSSDHYTTICNAIDILGRLVIPDEKIPIVSALLIKFAISSKRGELVQNRALIALTSLKLNSKEIIDQIVSELSLSCDHWVRYGLYYLLHTSDYLDDYIDVFLDGIESILFNPAVNSSGRTQTRLGDEHWHLKLGLEKAKKPESIIKILTYFKQNPHHLKDAFINNELSVIAKNAAMAFAKDPKIFDFALDFFITLASKFFEKEAEKFKAFFDITCMRLHAFRLVFGRWNQDQQYLFALSSLATVECFEFLFQQYVSGEVTDHDIWVFQNYLSIGNRELYLPFNDFINKKTGNKFSLPQKRDFDKERKQRKLRDINLLFNKNEFLSEVKIIFENEQKQIFSGKEFLTLQTKRSGSSYSDVVVYTLNRIARQKPISLKTATQILNNLDWDYFCADKIFEYLEHNKDLTLSKEHNDHIAKWCQSTLSKVNFKTALTANKENTTTADKYAILLWFFLRRLHLTYPKNVLLDMFSFDWVEDNKMLGIKYLEEYLPIDEISSRILENLQIGIQNDDILINHLDYCRRKKIEQVLKYAFAEINNTLRNYELRQVALETFCELSSSLAKLEQLLPKISDDFKWNIVKQLVNRNNSYVKNYLFEVLSSSNEHDSLKASEFLMALQDPIFIHGLKFYVDWIKRHKKMPDESFDYSPLHSITSIDAVPYLIELLGLSYHKDFKQNNFHRLDNIILDLLTKMAIKSEKNYGLIKTDMLYFISVNSAIINDVNFLHSFLERLEQRYYISKNENLDVDCVIEKLDSIYA